MPENAQPHPPAQRFVFLLLQNFTLVSFAASVDALRLANAIARRKLYEWKLVTESGATVHCSCGFPIIADGGFEECRREDTIIVCGGVQIAQAVTRGVQGWLRRETRRGARVGALCTGSWALAEAGLLGGKRATIHWETQDSFSERFPDTDLIRTIFVMDGPLMSAAGGTSAIDLLLALIARDHGPELASQVADMLLHTSIRTAGDNQRLSIPTRIGVRHPRLASIVARMEANLEEPVSPAQLAVDAGMSPRQLERLFARYLGRSPKRYYMEIRLERARNLLSQTEMSVIEIALACGFTSSSHFSKCYRAAYGTTPYRQRLPFRVEPDDSLQP